jgi:hypothetical protein
MFCCTTCKENAMNSYHDKEARLLSILENSGIGQEEWLISLRLVLSKSLSFFLKNRKELLANCERRDYAANDSIDDETFMSSDYSSVFNLVILFSLRTLITIFSKKRIPNFHEFFYENTHNILDFICCKEFGKKIGIRLFTKYVVSRSSYQETYKYFFFVLANK